MQREQQIAEQITSDLQSGTALRLGSSRGSFLAIHLPSSTRETLGGVILLHDMDADPNTTAVIRPLRIGLSDRGWETLSIQLPLASQNADSQEYRSLTEEALPRIQAAIDFFGARQNLNLVLLGHGQGAATGLGFLSKAPAKEVRAFVAIGLTDMTSPDQSLTQKMIGALEMPMLDLFGSQDLENVVRGAKSRHDSAKRGGRRAYRQDLVSGADHDFIGLEEALLARISAWFRKVAAGMEVESATPPASAP